MKHENEHIQIFREEARDILDEISRFFKKWQSSPSDLELLAPILRDIHTLKGSSRMVGLIALNEYIHVLESILQNLSQQEISPNQIIFDEIQFFLDYLNNYFDVYNDAISLENSRMPIERLKKLAQNVKIVKPSTGKKIASKNKLAKQESIYYIRVESDKLEKFSALASQVNITRAHLEQNLKDVSVKLTDLTKQVRIVLEQLKYLQVKADANMSIYSSSISESISDEFDVIEMDRYSFFQKGTRDLSEKVHNINKLAETTSNLVKNAEIKLVEQKRTGKALEEGIIRSRLISINKLLPRLERVVRQVSRELNKEVHLESIRVEGEIHRKALERLIPAFEHMVRNAIDHGIESPEVRQARNKPPYGVIKLMLFKQGNEIVVQLKDDGQGIDINKIKKKAIEKKLWEPNVPLSKADALQLIFLPGFSTKDRVTPISGQGVGLDVVNAEVKKLGGTIQVDSEPDLGTQFTIRLPFSLSLNKALIFQIEEQYYALPLSHLVGIQRYPIATLHNLVGGKRTLQYNNNEYKTYYLGELLGVKQCNLDTTDNDDKPVVFLKSSENHVAILVDKLVGSWEIVIKPIGSQLQFIREISGVSLFGEEKIVLILDPEMLIQHALKNKQARAMPKVANAQATILIVDDSITVREVTASFLKRHHYTPISARNGNEALAYMAENIPDAVLLDLEMPEMDGFEVLKKMRSNPRLRKIPVVIITSRSGDKHRVRAFEMGVSGYFTKPYLEEHLLALLAGILNNE